MTYKNIDHTIHNYWTALTIPTKPITHLHAEDMLRIYMSPLPCQYSRQWLQITVALVAIAMVHFGFGLGFSSLFLPSSFPPFSLFFLADALGGAGRRPSRNTEKMPILVGFRYSLSHFGEIYQRENLHYVPHDLAHKSVLIHG